MNRWLWLQLWLVFLWICLFWRLGLRVLRAYPGWTSFLQWTPFPNVPCQSAILEIFQILSDCFVKTSNIIPVIQLKSHGNEQSGKYETMGWKRPLCPLVLCRRCTNGTYSVMGIMIEKWMVVFQSSHSTLLLHISNILVLCASETSTNEANGSIGLLGFCT